MNRKLTCYGARISFIRKEVSDEGRAVEEEMNIQYTAKDEEAAIRDAIRFAKGRLKCLTDLKLMCAIKVFTKLIMPIGPEGEYNSQSGPLDIFEWKYDWPGTLEDYLGEEARAKR